MNFRILPYKMGSEGAKALATALDCLRVYPDGNYWPKKSHILINWGHTNDISVLARANPGILLNYPSAVRRSCDKLQCFSALFTGGVSHPEWTTNPEEASDWELTVVRHLLNGTKGKGIELVEQGEEMPDAPLYTEYVKKTAEYRAHVFNDKVIDVQEKKQKKDFEDTDFKIRNHDNGWVFCREGIEPPQCIYNESLKAIRSVGLFFGAVDIVYNQHYDQAYVLEINTAPGLQGTTLEIYTKSFLEYKEEY